MQIWLGVKDFAIIENAKICLGEYILFVGQNNCGKTFLMQLIQGVLEKLIEFIDEHVLDILLDEDEDSYTSYMISNKNILQLVDYLNERLNIEKENVVKEIFQKEIPIGELYIDFRLEDDFAYKIFCINVKKNFRKHLGKILGPDPVDELFDLLLSIPIDEVCVLDYVNVKTSALETVSISCPYSKTDDHCILLRGSMQYIMESNSLFLPASRTGLLLLYREFFLNKADYAISYKVNKNWGFEKKQDYGGLTKPTYEFLRFLQRFSEDEQEKENFKNELQFFEDNLIDGHISADMQKTFLYRSNNDENEIPMYLASSMINEVAPIAMAITCGKHYERLIIDEIESSVHPEKQFELVRFLNRVNRKGKKLIISTHSDTFVSKMNNLYILSHYNQQFCESIVAIRKERGLKINSEDILEDLDFLKDLNEKELKILLDNAKRMNSILKKLKLNSNDFINPRSLLVYEFIRQDNGKSIVKEIHGNEKTGFQFDLFASSAMRLYDETLKIGELLE